MNDNIPAPATSTPATTTATATTIVTSTPATTIATSIPATTIATSRANYKHITNCSISNQRSKQSDVCPTTDAASNNRKTFIYKL